MNEYLIPAGSSGLAYEFLGKLVEVCIVSCDYRRSMIGLNRLGIGPWRVYTFSPDTVTDGTYRGQPAAFSIKVCFAEAGDLTWEIM